MSLSHSEVVNDMISPAVAYGREHGVSDEEMLWMMRSELGMEPEDEEPPIVEHDMGNEVDDQGGMSERRFEPYDEPL